MQTSLTANPQRSRLRTPDSAHGRCGLGKMTECIKADLSSGCEQGLIRRVKAAIRDGQRLS